MRSKISITIVLFLYALFFSSCATYTVSREVLYATIHDAKHITIDNRVGGIKTYSYVSNGAASIKCISKHGDTVTVMNSPSIEMRITDTNGSRHNFYFDTALFEDSVLTGYNSRFLGTRKSLPYGAIKKVEIQDGHKRYYYTSR